MVICAGMRVCFCNPYLMTLLLATTASYTGSFSFFILIVGQIISKQLCIMLLEKDYVQTLKKGLFNVFREVVPYLTGAKCYK